MAIEQGLLDACRIVTEAVATGQGGSDDDLRRRFWLWGGSNQTSFAEYASLADLAAGNDISGGGVDINPNIPTSSYIFYDSSSFYKTTINTGINSGINTVIQYPTLADLAGDVSGVTHELKSGGSAASWSLNDDFYADGPGN